MSENLNKIYNNVLITIPYTIYLSSILASISSDNYDYMYFFLCAVLLGDGLNHVIKESFKHSNILPKNVGLRPSGCGGPKVNGLCRGCGIYDNYKDKIGSKTYGFPSGHAHILSLTMTFWTIYIINKHEHLEFKHYLSIFFMWSIFLLVCIQRLKSRCHNIYQIIGGGLIGAIMGIFSYYLCNKFAPNTFKYKK